MVVVSNDTAAAGPLKQKHSNALKPWHLNVIMSLSVPNSSLLLCPW